VADSPTTRDLLLREVSARAVTALWERIDIAMMSIGLLNAGTGVFYSLADPEGGVAAVVEKGGVGDILARPIDIDGQTVPTELVDRTIAIGPEELRQVPLVVGVATGGAKARAIQGALRTGLLNVLITDEEAAVRILELATAG
jgi:DNA-binding transcriptional regulator LsrR (DeoR family)